MKKYLRLPDEAVVPGATNKRISSAATIEDIVPSADSGDTSLPGPPFRKLVSDSSRVRQLPQGSFRAPLRWFCARICSPARALAERDASREFVPQPLRSKRRDIEEMADGESSKPGGQPYRRPRRRSENSEPGSKALEPWNLRQGVVAAPAVQNACFR